MVYFFIPPVQFKVCSYILFFSHKGTVSVGCKGSNRKISLGTWYCYQDAESIWRKPRGRIVRLPWTLRRIYIWGRFQGKVWQENFNKHYSSAFFSFSIFIIRFGSKANLLRKLPRVPSSSFWLAQLKVKWVSYFLRTHKDPTIRSVH